MRPLLPTTQLRQYNGSHVQTNSNTRRLNAPCSQAPFLLSTTVSYKYLFILNPLEDVFSTTQWKFQYHRPQGLFSKGR